MVEVFITFSADINDSSGEKCGSIKHYIYPADGKIESGLYDRIMQYTNNHELAASVVSWAELAPVGDIYETDDLIAEIVERDY